MITATYSMSDLEHKEAPMPHHVAGLSYTRTGYGRRIPTTHMVKLPGGKRWRRVYVCQFSNSGMAYVTDRNGNCVVITY